MKQSGDRRVCRSCCAWSKLSDCRYPAFLSFKSKGKRIHAHHTKRSCWAARPNGLAARPEKLVQRSQRRLPRACFRDSGKHRRQPENMDVFFQRSRSQRSVCPVWRLASGSWRPFPVHRAAHLILSPKDGAMTSYWADLHRRRDTHTQSASRSFFSQSGHSDVEDHCPPRAFGFAQCGR